MTTRRSRTACSASRVESVSPRRLYKPAKTNGPSAGPHRDRSGACHSGETTRIDRLPTAPAVPNGPFCRCDRLTHYTNRPTCRTYLCALENCNPVQAPTPPSIILAWWRCCALQGRLSWRPLPSDARHNSRKPPVSPGGAGGSAHCPPPKMCRA